MVTREDLAYTAGIIDGEGSITIHRYSYQGRFPENFSLIVQVSMVDNVVPQWLHNTFGGSLNRHRPQEPKWSTINHWTISTLGAEKFLRAVLPWLKLKKAQAELALRFRATVVGRGHYIGEVVREQRRQFYHEMRALKKVT